MGLDADLKMFAERVGKQVGEIVKNTAVEIMRDIQSKAAIDEGTLKASINMSVDEPDLSFKPAKGTTTLQAPVPGPIKSDQTIFITSNLPYSQRVLQEGWSEQTPENMVEDVVEKAKLKLKAGRF